MDVTSDSLSTLDATSASHTGLRTVGTDTPVASIKFTGIIREENAADSDSDSSTNACQDFDDYQGHDADDESKSSQNKTMRSVHSTIASVRFTGLMNDDGDESDASAESDPGAAQTNPFFSQAHTGSARRPLSDIEQHTHSLSLPKSVVKQSLSSDNIGAEMGVIENHYSQIEDDCGPRTIPELEAAIEQYKKLVSAAIPRSEAAKDLTRTLINLRLRLLEAKDVTSEVDSGVKIVMGHPFQNRPWGSAAKHYCERCNKMIVGIFQKWLKCTVCGFCCHERCLNLITRTCAGVKVSENPSYILDICPEKGLHVQNYHCAECRANIGFQKAEMREARLCDYNGLFYCDHCHWNDTTVILSRVLANWDFQPRKICRSSKQILKLMIRKAIVRVQDINPMLFSYLEELNQVKKHREEILIMKKYFLLCNDALKSRLLCQLEDRQHFVENSDMYSVQDLIDLANDVLLPELTKIHASFAQHIKTDCEACRSKGYACLICSDPEILFPFDNCAFVCPDCANVVHRHCYISKGHRCPKCQRSSQTFSPES